MREVLRSLNCEIANDLEVKKRKVEELKELVINGRKIKAIRILAGYLSDEDAFRAEALAITLINSSRAVAGTKLLLNAVNGHHAQRVSDMQEHFLYTQADDELLPAKPDEYAILVKKTDKESVDSNWNQLKTPFIHKRKEVEKSLCAPTKVKSDHVEHGIHSILGALRKRMRVLIITGPLSHQESYLG